MNEISRQVRDAFQGVIPRRFAEGDDEITIRISQVMRNQGAAALRSFELKSPAGEFVPLSEVVKITERQGFASIDREDGKATVSVTGDIDAAITTTEKVIEILEASGLPAIATKYGIAYKFGGRSEESRKAFADLGVGAAIALSIIYIILAWVFASYWKPFAVMMIIPFGIVGAVFGHWILGYKLTILSMAGLLGLAGILVNDSIILVSRMDERLAFGQSIRTASVGASLDRLRAVLLTSLTTVGGLLPLLFEKSLQAQFLLPMAITIVFGLASATLLVLFLVPALMAVGEDIGWLLRSIYGRGSASVDTRVSPAE
jgi:multidrug efflux pump subunit AcrB